MAKKYLLLIVIPCIIFHITCISFSAKEISEERSNEVYTFLYEYTDLFEQAIEDASVPFPYLLVAEKYRDRAEYEAVGQKYLSGNLLNGYLNNLIIKGFNGRVGTFNQNLIESVTPISIGIPKDATPVLEIQKNGVVYRFLTVKNGLIENPFMVDSYIYVDKWEYVESTEEWCLSQIPGYFPRTNSFDSQYGDNSEITTLLKENIPYALEEEPPFKDDDVFSALRLAGVTILTSLHLHNLYADTSLYLGENQLTFVEIDGETYALRSTDNLTYDHISAVIDLYYSEDLASEYLKKDSFVEYDGYIAAKVTDEKETTYDIKDNNLIINVSSQSNGKILQIELDLPQHNENGDLISTEKALMILQKTGHANPYYEIIYEEYTRLTNVKIPDTNDTLSIYIITTTLVILALILISRCYFFKGAK